MKIKLSGCRVIETSHVTISAHKKGELISISGRMITDQMIDDIAEYDADFYRIEIGSIIIESTNLDNLIEQYEQWEYGSYDDYLDDERDKLNFIYK